MNEGILNSKDCIELSFQNDGNLVSINPPNAAFCGWSNENIVDFNLERNFLIPNQWTFSKVVEVSEDMPTRIDPLIWLDTQHNQFIFDTLWQSSTPQNDDPVFKATIQVPNSIDSEINYVFNHWGKRLPEFFHSINGLLGILRGRIDLTRESFPEIEEMALVKESCDRMMRQFEIFNRKVFAEASETKRPYSLNDLLNCEFKFLEFSPFFRYQVVKKWELSPNIPDIVGSYVAISGILSEIVDFFQKFTQENRQYVMEISSFLEDEFIGFSLELHGEFSDANLPIILPIELEGKADVIAEFATPLFNHRFISQCMTKTNGIFKISGNDHFISAEYHFPIPQKRRPPKAACHQSSL